MTNEMSVGGYDIRELRQPWINIPPNHGENFSGACHLGLGAEQVFLGLVKGLLRRYGHLFHLDFSTQNE